MLIPFSRRFKGVRIDGLCNVQTALYAALGKRPLLGAGRDMYLTAGAIYALVKGKDDAGVAGKSPVLLSGPGRATELCRCCFVGISSIRIVGERVRNGRVLLCPVEEAAFINGE